MRKKKKAVDPTKVIRRAWGFNPTTRVKGSKKDYNRKDKSWGKED